jgi:hypothetical protein
LLENVHGFGHFTLYQEISDKIIDYYFTFDCLCMGNHAGHRGVLFGVRNGFTRKSLLCVLVFGFYF